MCEFSNLTCLSLIYLPASFNMGWFPYHGQAGSRKKLMNHSDLMSITNYCKLSWNCEITQWFSCRQWYLCVHNFQKPAQDTAVCTDVRGGGGKKKDLLDIYTDCRYKSVQFGRVFLQVVAPAKKGFHTFMLSTCNSVRQQHQCRFRLNRWVLEA